jgi:hypothetical protein
MKKISRASGYSAIVAALAFVAGCSTMGGGDIALRMTGAEEVPPVSTSASGTGSLRVAEDRSVTGTFKTQGGPFAAAHIHEGAPGQNGPVIIPLTKSGENDWIVPANAKLTDAQFESYKAGRLYVNFHSAKFKGGEIRAQIRPSGSGGSGH